MPSSDEVSQSLIKDIHLKEVSSQAGIHFQHHNDPMFNDGISKLVEGLTPFYEAMSASVSVVDINNDGWPDFFAPSSEWGSQSHLYINNHDGTFTEEAEKYGLADLPFPTRAGFFDADNDGVPEMLLSTFKCPILYKMNDKGKYLPIFNFPEPCTLTTAFNIYDYNHDGLLDIVIAPFSRTVPNNWHGSDNGPGGVTLYKNKGACHFEIDSNALNETEKRFTHAIGVGDFRGKNTQDLWAATDFNLDRVFFEEAAGGDKKYIKQKDDILSLSKAHNGMGVQSAYIYDNNIPSVYVSQAFEPGYATTGNQLWTFNGESFVDSARKLNINNCQWSWGSNFSDINNDGKIDLLIANGFISGNTDKSYWKKIGRFALGTKKYLGDPWNWSSFRDINWSGHQRDCVFLNTDNGFVNIAEMIDFDHDQLDGRGIANIDALNTGKMGFLVANQKQNLKFYKNESANLNGWIGFKLIGTSSNRDAIGANVWLELSDGRVQRYSHYPFNGYSSQSDARIHFGLGHAHLKKVKIRWPNGLETSYDSLKENAYNTIIEGKPIDESKF